jgi:hypothetical protein
MKVKISIPENLNDITLGQYQKYFTYIDKLDGDELAIKKIEILCNLTREQILLFQYSEVQRLSSLLDQILDTKPSLIQKFTVADVKFGWLPKLDDMSYGELLDLNGNISDWDNMHIAMCVLYRPIKKEAAGLYNIEKYEGAKYHEHIKEMPLSAVIGALVFFWNLGMDLLKFTVQSLTETEENRTHLAKNGIGTERLMRSLEEISQSLKL